jgi:Holliday junction DNA helicase RuvA
MIGFLRGVLIEKTPEALLLDVGGVGYEITVPASSLCALPPEGHAAHLYIHTHVREDALRLFGFATLFDRKVFEALLSVNSVGPKLAVGLLGPLDGVELCRALVEASVPVLVSIPGVGAKTAERLILELKPKCIKLLALRPLYEKSAPFGAASAGSAASADGGSFVEGKRSPWEASDDADATLFPVDHASLGASSSKGSSKVEREARDLEERLHSRRAVEDLRSALENIGYKEKQIEGVLREFEGKLKAGEPVVLEVALRDALRKLSGHLFKETKERDAP